MAPWQDKRDLPFLSITGPDPTREPLERRIMAKPIHIKGFSYPEDDFVKDGKWMKKRFMVMTVFEYKAVFCQNPPRCLVQNIAEYELPDGTRKCGIWLTETIVADEVDVMAQEVGESVLRLSEMD